MIDIDPKKGDIQFIEDFVLADDRESLLTGLIPGTEDYYYFHALHFLNSDNLSEVKKHLDRMKKEFDTSGKTDEIEKRYMLQLYDTDPEKTLQYLQDQFGLYFDHQRQVSATESELPTQISFSSKEKKERLSNAFEWYPYTTDGFEAVALTRIQSRKLNPETLTHLLERLERPIGKDLASLIVTDLKNRETAGFGSLKIHHKLTKAQLTRCLSLMPELKNEEPFVYTYLKRLLPDNNTDIDQNLKAYTDYIRRLQDFTDKLDQPFNSLKAHVLFYRLKHDLEAGEINRETVLSYLKIPKEVSYINRESGIFQTRSYTADLYKRFDEITLLPPVADDEAVIKMCLGHLFKKLKSFDLFSEYISNAWLKAYFAEVMITSGSSDIEKLSRLLTTDRFREIKNRVELDFTPDCKRRFALDEKVSLTLSVKNVSTLIIKTFILNPENIYRQSFREITGDINLDGLSPHHERIETYDTPSFESVIRNYTFPEINDRGIFVVEFIGNGKSSRAIIRKGSLRFHDRHGIAGHQIAVYNESDIPVKECSAIIGKHEFYANQNGVITIPYTTEPGSRKLVLKSGQFSELKSFFHSGETYSLRAGIHMERESLQPEQTAQILIRPALFLNDSPVSLRLLENASVTITSTDLDDIVVKKVINDITLTDEKALICEYPVPCRLNRIEITLDASVHNVTLNEDQNLNACGNFILNELERTAHREDLYLFRENDACYIEITERSGDILPGRSVTAILKFRDYTDEYRYPLKTGKDGRIKLSGLDDAEAISVEVDGAIRKRWELTDNTFSYPDVIHTIAGKKLSLPVFSGEDSTASLFEIRGNGYYRNCEKSLTQKEGVITVTIPDPGDYELYIESANASITIRAAVPGSTVDKGYILDKFRHLSLAETLPPYVRKIKHGKKETRIQIGNPGKNTRIHLFATRYKPAFQAYNHFHIKGRFPENRLMIAAKENLYQSGRDIGDEYRYILERKMTKHFPGNDLEKPTLLLSPWDVRSTDVRDEVLSDQSDWSAAGAAPCDERYKEAPSEAPTGTGSDNVDTIYDFLVEPAFVSLNLTPDTDGMISVPSDGLAGKRALTILITNNRDMTTCQGLSLKQSDKVEKRNSLIYKSPFDPNSNYAQENRARILSRGNKYTLNRTGYTKLAIYDSVESIYNFYLTLTHDTTLEKFRFIIEWPELSGEEKLKKYGEFACHELNFYLFRKDPDFFNRIVIPFIKEKPEKTFPDKWLLAESDEATDSYDSLREYRQTWNYSSLNIFEKILLSFSLPEERKPTIDLLKNRLKLQPQDSARNHHLFITALNGGEDFFRGIGGSDGPPPSPASGSTPHPSATPARLKSTSPRAAMKKKAFDKEESPIESIDDLMDEYEEEICESAFDDGDFGIDDEDDFAERRAPRRFYQKAEKTKELAENHYYCRLRSDETNSLIPLNRFWVEFAEASTPDSFLSPQFMEACGNFTEMMFALAAMDMPIRPKSHKIDTEESSITIRPVSNAILFHRDTIKIKERPALSSVLANQIFFQYTDQYDYSEDGKTEKQIQEVFYTGIVYGCRTIVTNTSHQPVRLNVLTEIPEGSVPVLNSAGLRGTPVDLEAFSTDAIEYYFYFPKPGTFAHLPVHVSDASGLVAWSDPFVFQVSDPETGVDNHSWEYISQYGTDKEVLEYIETINPETIDLERIAFRMSSFSFFKKTISILSTRHIFNESLWAYGIFHNHLPAITEYLKFNTGFLESLVNGIDTRLIKSEPFERKIWQHFEYSPLINPRAHRLGERHSILNDAFFKHYHQHLHRMACTASPDEDKWISLVCYLLLQGRDVEAEKIFNRLDPKKINGKMQYDYFSVYFAYCKNNLQEGIRISKAYLNYPVPDWQKRFKLAYNELQLLSDNQNERISEEGSGSLQEDQKRYIDSEPSIDVRVTESIVRIQHKNIEELELKFYQMDVELLFSRNPFTKKTEGNFTSIMPLEKLRVKADTNSDELTIPLPEKYRNKNIIIAAVAGGLTRTFTRYANNLSVHIIENYGHLIVRNPETGQALPSVYVKVYGEYTNGVTRFYKDGYTSLAGKFDYASLNRDELDRINRFSIMVMSEEYGVVVEETAPPAR